MSFSTDSHAKGTFSSLPPWLNQQESRTNDLLFTEEQLNYTLCHDILHNILINKDFKAAKKKHLQTAYCITVSKGCFSTILQYHVSGTCFVILRGTICIGCILRVWFLNRTSIFRGTISWELTDKEKKI